MSGYLEPAKVIVMATQGQDMHKGAFVRDDVTLTFLYICNEIQGIGKYLPYGYSSPRLVTFSIKK